MAQSGKTHALTFLEARRTLPAVSFQEGGDPWAIARGAKIGAPGAV
jgi:hypothetical protein